jgi:hypothetical protein
LIGSTNVIWSAYKSPEHQLQAYRLNLQKAQDKIHRLTAEIRQAMQDALNLNPSQSPAEHVSLDVVKNHGRHPNGRRYPIDTLIWAHSCCFSCGP